MTPMLCAPRSFTPMTTVTPWRRAASRRVSTSGPGTSIALRYRRSNHGDPCTGFIVQFQYGYPGTNASGKATSVAPFPAASAIRSAALATVAAASR